MMNPISKLEPGGKTKIYIASQGLMLKPDENQRVQGLVFNNKDMVTMATMATML